jgi:hypothetical protein
MGTRRRPPEKAFLPAGVRRGHHATGRRTSASDGDNRYRRRYEDLADRIEEREPEGAYDRMYM